MSCASATIDGGTTDSAGLLDAGIELAAATWAHAGAADLWGSRDRYIFHQVSEVHTKAMIARSGSTRRRCRPTFPRYGNIGPAAIPITLAAVADELTRRRYRPVHGDRVRPERRGHRTPVVAPVAPGAPPAGRPRISTASTRPGPD